VIYLEKWLLITGGAGFIGSHLSEYLLKNYKKIIVIDNFNDFYDPKIKRNNIKEIVETMKINNINYENLIVEEGDIRDTEFLDRIFKRNNIELIVHLAAMAGVRPSIENPILYSDVNIKGTVNLLEMCKKYGIDKFIFASSSSVYGNNEKIPFSEEDNVDFSISPYAATKKSGELLCYVYHMLYDVNIACLRFFTVYGPRQRPDLAIYKFTKLIFNDEEIPVYGDGSTERDYTYIDDIIDGIVKTINWIKTGKGKYEIFNLGESNTIALEYLVRTLEKIIGKNVKIKRFPLQLGDVKRTYADISKSKRILGYNPITDFEEGIRTFVEWYRKN
jgi:UDP-glucuronate 4-epimerase